MANELDEKTGPVNAEGNDINVINKQLTPKLTGGSKFLIILMWIFIIPGIIFWFKTKNAKEQFKQLEQRIQHSASQIDNYLEQRVQIMQNVVGIVEKAISLDKEIMTTVAAYRGGYNPQQVDKMEAQSQISAAMRSINVQIEAYPELKSHASIANAMQQNSYLQKEITAAREVYNDAILKWNKNIFDWLVNLYVAVKEQYTTRVPFSVSKEVKEQARSKFF